MVRTLTVKSPRDIAVMARDDQVRVSVASPPQPGVELASACYAQLASMRRAVVFDVIEAQEFDMPLATAAAINIAVTVVEKRSIAILAEARHSVLVVALPTP